MNWKIRILSLATAIVIGVVSWAAGAVHGKRAAELWWSHHSVMLLGAHNDALPITEWARCYSYKPAVAWQCSVPAVGATVTVMLDKPEAGYLQLEVIRTVTKAEKLVSM
jgi:hypothetical protein